MYVHDLHDTLSVRRPVSPDPPRPSDLVCETHDLTSAVCRWKGGRDTNLYGKRGTKYMLNNRYRSQTQWSPQLKLKRMAVTRPDTLHAPLICFITAHNLQKKHDY